MQISNNSNITMTDYIEESYLSHDERLEELNNLNVCNDFEV